MSHSEQWMDRKLRQVAYNQVAFGEPIRSETTWIYQVGLFGFCDSIAHDSNSAGLRLDDIFCRRRMLNCPSGKHRIEREGNIVPATIARRCVSPVDFPDLTSQWRQTRI